MLPDLGTGAAAPGELLDGWELLPGSSGSDTLTQKEENACGEAGLFLTTPFTEGCDGVNHQTLPPGHSNTLYF